MNYTAILNITTVDVDNNTRNNTNTTPPLIERLQVQIVYLIKNKYGTIFGFVWFDRN